MGYINSFLSLYQDIGIIGTTILISFITAITLKIPAWQAIGLMTATSITILSIGV